jgi:hypothetical protein
MRSLMHCFSRTGTMFTELTVPFAVWPLCFVFSPSMFNQTACALGSFCPSGSATEADCPAGKFCQTPALAEDCPLGRYSASKRLIAAADCTPCPNGMRGTVAGQTTQSSACGPCTAGSYCINGIGTPCASGAYCPSGTSTVNPPCPLGSYCNSTSNVAACPLGRYGQVARQTALTQCTACVAGKYGAAAGATTEAAGCTNCPLGTWGSAPALPALSSCTSCVAGKVGVYAGQSFASSACASCPQGNYCLGGTSQVPCAVGSSCPQGTSVPNPPCRLGSYCPTPSLLLDCPAGRFGAATGLIADTDCTACAAGQYGTVTGATSESAACVPCTATPGTGLSCPPGSTSDSPPCPKGFYCPDVSTVIGCPLGSFGEWTGFISVTSCTECAVGRYTALSGQSSEEAACPGCPVGRWTGALLNSVTGCTNCAVGKVGTFAGQTNELAACAAPCSATRTPPVNGAMAECAGTAAGVYACWPACKPYYALSGQSTCTGSTFTSATCNVCMAGQSYTVHNAAVVRLRENGTFGSQQQGARVQISSDGSIMVQSAPADNAMMGGQCMTKAYGG